MALKVALEARVAPKVAPGRPEWLRKWLLALKKVAPESPHSRMPRDPRRIFYNARVDPCIKCTRSKLATGEVAAG